MSRILDGDLIGGLEAGERAVPPLFGSYCGCSDSREVWISRSAMPLLLMAASTAVICFALASLASRAVLSWLLTPMRITAAVRRNRDRCLAGHRYEFLGRAAPAASDKR